MSGRAVEYISQSQADHGAPWQRNISSVEADVGTEVQPLIFPTPFLQTSADAVDIYSAEGSTATSNRPPASPLERHSKLKARRRLQCQRQSPSFTSQCYATPVPQSPKESVPIYTTYGPLTLTASLNTIDGLTTPMTPTRLGPKFTSAWSPDEFILGEIILAPWFAPSLSPSTRVTSPTFAWANATGPIVAKRRPVIVVARLPQGLLTIPMFSHSGSGLHHLPVHKRQRTLRIRGAKDQDIFWDSISSDDYVTVRSDGEWTPRPETAAEIELLWTVGLRWPVARLEAALEAQDVGRLIRRVFGVLDEGVNEMDYEEEFCES